MTTPTTLEQARAFAIDYGPHNEHQWPLLASNLILSLASQVESLTVERDRLQYEVDAIPAIKEERDALALDVDQWRVDYHELRLEHDALMSAAKLALDALDESTSYTSCSMWSPSMTRDCQSAIAALRQAGVQ